ncbi:hypothetical protein H4582DRAFT_1003036 [Lactarius indigo]|nr:hypothetical protein H4582DRAFT_1003036 [Lactarius indigo]
MRQSLSRAYKAHPSHGARPLLHHPHLLWCRPPLNLCPRPLRIYTRCLTRPSTSRVYQRRGPTLVRDRVWYYPLRHSIPSITLCIGVRDPPQSAQHQTLHGESNFSDGSGHLFTMYNEMAEEEDKKMAESWKADADGILVFTGLFSAAVATLVALSIQDLRPNSQDTSAFYLQHIYQLLADPNRSNVSIPLVPPPFSPPRYAVWVNSLWFLSLAISLTCALLATLLQQWARRYIKITQPRYSPHRRGRIRAFFYEGIDKFHLPWAVEALPTLLHLSLFLFFSGLLVFLLNIDHTVFSVVVGWVEFCTAIYVSITFVPLFRHDSPYYAPPSSSAWFLATGVLTVLFQTFWWLVGLSRLATFGRKTKAFLEMGSKRYHKWFVDGLVKTAEDFALNSSSEIDGRVLMWTLNSSDDDQELERFFAAIPGFCSSKVLDDPGSCIRPNGEKMTEALIGFVHRTLTSNLITRDIKQRRLDICREAMDVAPFGTIPQFFHRFIDAEWDGLLSSIEFGLWLGRADHHDTDTAYYLRIMVSVILPRVEERDERWFKLATDNMDVSRLVLKSYLAHGDSILLATCIHVLRNIIHADDWIRWPGDVATLRTTLALVSNFDIEDTLPTLQHDFCDLWNWVVSRAMASKNNQTGSHYIIVLKTIRRAYITLHQGTDSAPTAFSASTTDDEHILSSPFSYPECRESSHSWLTSQIYDSPEPIDSPVLPPASLSTTSSELSLPTSYPYYSSSPAYGYPMFYPMSQSPVNPLVPSNYTPQSGQINNNVHQLYTNASPMSNFESYYPPVIPAYPASASATRRNTATETMPYPTPEVPYTPPDMPDIPSTSTSALALDLGTIFNGGKPSSDLPTGTSRSDDSMLFVPAQTPWASETPLPDPTDQGETISNRQANENGNDSMAAGVPYDGDVEDVDARLYDKSAFGPPSPIAAVIPMHSPEDA